MNEHLSLIDENQTAKGEIAMGTVHFLVNNQSYTLDSQTKGTLLHILRNDLGLTGTKCGCQTGDCGTCMVILNGKATRSCLVTIKNLDGAVIQTIEGLSTAYTIHPIQQAFIDAGAIQCGFCTPGMVMSAKALLDVNPNPTQLEIRQAIDHNLCRCTGYEKIVEAILLAAQRMGGTI